MSSNELSGLINAIGHSTCWYASCGGSAGSAFILAMGRKIPRKKPLKNTAHSEEYRLFEGEKRVFIRCAWRLRKEDSLIGGSDDDSEVIERAISRLVGEEIESVQVEPLSWDLTLGFSGNYILSVFCSHVTGNPQYDDNWQILTQDAGIIVGPGNHYRLRGQGNRGNG